MAHLGNDHVDYIVKDLSFRGIVADGIGEEIIDHVCSAVEDEMDSGLRFYDAYQNALQRFGHNSGLRRTQKETINAENRTAKIMIRNYFTIAMRNLSKHRFYTFINIFGLAVGIASCLLISLYVKHELSYDKHFQNAERIYRIDSELLFNGNHHDLAVAPAPLAEAMMSDFPEIESAVRFRSWGPRLIKTEKNPDNLKEHHILFGDNNFFHVFSWPLLKGNAGTALKDPNSVVISKSKADKYFPSIDPIGQTLIVDNEHVFKVTGVFEDFPATTHFKLDVILSMNWLEESRNGNWLSNNFNTYVLLREGNQVGDLINKFPKMIETYIGPQVQQAFGSDFTMEKFYQGGNKLEYYATALTDIHLHSDRTAELAPNSDVTYVYLFAAIALFILGIACINFMNLSTARSSNRAKEVGVRKVLGSLRSHLVRQFLMESVLLSMFSFAIAVVLLIIALPYFNTLAGRTLSIPFTDPFTIGLLIIASLFVGVMAGVYPSFFLSAFKPVNVLKGKVALGMKSGIIRSSLVVFQFMISIFLIIGTITVQRQLSFIQNKKIGFTKDQVIILHDTGVLGNQTDVFRNEMLKEPGITNVSASGFLPIAGWGRNDSSFWPEGSQPSQENLISMQYWTVDHEYVETLGMNIIQGRNFSADFPSDSLAIIMNETAVKRFGFANPLGQKITTYDFNNGKLDPSKTLKYHIVGVVEDFHFESLRQNITPLILQLGRSTGNMLFRFQSANTEDVISALEKRWKALAPSQPFQYTFLDEAFGNMYSSEQRLGTIFGIFAGLAIIIACLGLFALTAFTAEQRTKEIGIRKVLGASVNSIVFLLSLEFGKLIVIAFVLAAPLSWFAVDWWLQNYTYKAHVGLAIYLMAGCAAFLVAWLTMGYQSLKAAMSNPVNSLRSE